MHVALFVLPLTLAGCLDADVQHQTSNARADGQPIIYQATARFPTDAIELVRGNNAVGHLDFVDAKKVFPWVFVDIEEDFYCCGECMGKDINLASCGYVPH